MHVDEITILPGRQREDLGDLTELCHSIKNTGIIHPIVIDSRDLSLIAGERRLSALKITGTTELYEGEHFRLVTPANDFQRHAIELEENIRRSSLTPPEKAKAVKAYHKLYQQIYGEAVQNVGGGHSQVDTAKALGMSTGSISDHIAVADMLEARPELATEQTMSAIKQKFKHKRVNEIKAEIANRRTKILAVDIESMLHLGDSVEFLQSLDSASVDCIITDIPFGIEVFESASLGDAATEATWDDDPEKVIIFVRDLVGEIWRVLKDNTHCFIFCAWHQTHYLEKFSNLYQDFVCEIPPMIWHRVSATPSRNPSLTCDKSYEYIIHLRKGSPTFPDRLGPDIINCPRIKNPQYPTEKPLELLHNLVELGSLPGQLIIDPCHGSGGTLVAAIQLERAAKGSDISPVAHETTKRRLVMEAFDGEHAADDESDRDGFDYDIDEGMEYDLEDD